METKENSIENSIQETKNSDSNIDPALAGLQIGDDTPDEIACWVSLAKEVGFDEAAPLDPAGLVARKEVRAMCEENRCHVYNNSWTCPPNCGTIEECAEKMHSYSRGIILQTVQKLEKSIDTKGYAAAEKKHTARLDKFRDLIRGKYPDALVLGAGVCHVCPKCAYPEPCRFPDRAQSSMEGYGLFVTQVCRDNNVKYYYGPRTIAYTGCALF